MTRLPIKSRPEAKTLDAARIIRWGLTTMSSTATPRIRRDAVERAVSALLKWLRRHGRSGGSGDEFVYLILTLKKVAHKGRPSSFRLPLPHPDPLLSARLLVDDRPSSPLPPSAARAAVLSLSLPVADVLPLSALRSLPPAARRSLADSPSSLLLADRRVAPLLPHLLNNSSSNNTSKGKGKSRNPPVPINLSRESWPDELRAVCRSTPFRLAGGTCGAIRVGRASQRQDEIVANVAAAAEAAVGRVPRKWANVRAFHIKAAESLALPIYYDPASGMRIESQTKDEAKANEDAVEKKLQKRKRSMESE